MADSYCEKTTGGSVMSTKIPQKRLKMSFTQQLGDLALAIDLDVPMQGITAIFGRSGAGKTSLVNVLSGLSHPDNGYIQLGERVII